MERLSERSEELPIQARGLALYTNVRLATVQCDIEVALARFSEAIPLMRLFADPVETGLALVWYGGLMGSLGRYEEAESLLIDARKITGAAPASQRKHAIYGDTLANLGAVARGRGEFLLASERHEEALAYYKSHGIEHGEIRSGLDLADVARDRGNFRLATQRYQMFLFRVVEMRDERLIADGLEGLASSVVGSGELVFAARLCGMAEELRERVGVGFRWAADEAALRRCLAALQTGLDSVSLSRAWNEGRQMTLGDLLNEVESFELPPLSARVPDVSEGWPA